MRGAFLVDIELLKPDPLQPRKSFDKNALAGLASSIRKRGIRQPIRVRNGEKSGTFWIVSGERRFRASVLAGLSEIPCIIDTTESSTRNVRIDQVVENWQRADLEPVELHLALVQLRDEEGMTQEEIAEELGKSPSEISRFLSFGKVRAEILEEARSDKSGRFTRTTLEALAQVPHTEQEELAERIRSGSVSAKRIEREARRLKKRARGGNVGNSTGATRRFVVGNATVAVHFRKKEVTGHEVAEVLRRAAVIAEQNESK